MITAGIDCGAKNTKAAILRDGKLIGRGKVLTGFDPGKAAEESLTQAVTQAGIARSAIQKTFGTGSGRAALEAADDTLDEIKAMAKGAHFFFPNARTVADVGAEEGRAAKLDERGNAVDFVVNEKCAAGAGAFVEAMARALEVSVEEMGLLCLESDKQIPMNAQCVVFAESEVVGLIHSKTSKPDISKAIHDAIAGRIGSMIRQIGVNEEVVLIGGLGRNPGFMRAMTKQLQLERLQVPEEPEFGAAVGAAVGAAGAVYQSGRACGARAGRPLPVLRGGITPVAEEKKQEFWRWPESNWKNPELDWRMSKFIAVGIDVGSVSSQAVIVADGQILAYGNMRTGADSPESARNAYTFALDAIDMPEERMNYCIGTGYGRVNVPFANRTLTEIACHARGATFIYGPGVRTVLDVGGQDIKCIQCDEKGKVTNFLMNDKCAAGTGRGMEVFADLLGVSITEVGDRSFEFKGEEPPAVSSTCVVYAKSEAADMLRRGSAREEVLAAFCQAMADRIFCLVERGGVKPGVAVTGGVAKNRGVMDRLMKKIGIERMPTQWDPQIAGAAGAALFAYALCLRGR